MRILFLVIFALGFVDIFANISFGVISGSALEWFVLGFIVSAKLLLVFDKIPANIFYQNLWFYLLISISVVNCVKSTNYASATVDIIYLLLPLFFWILAFMFVNTYCKLRRVIKLIIILPVVPIIIFVFSYVFGYITYIEGLGPQSLIGMRSAALMVLVPAAVSIALLVNKHHPLRDLRALAGISLFLSTLVILVTLSRTSMLCLFICIIVAMSVTKQSLAKIGLLVMLALLVMSLFFVDPLRQRIVPEGISAEELATSGEFTSGRALIWTTLFDEAINKPFLGHGTGNAKDFVKYNFPTSAGLPHNEYLRIFYDLGILGLGLLVLALLSRLLRHFVYTSRPKYNIGVVACVIDFSALMCTLCAIVAGTFDNIFIYIFVTGNMFVIYGLADRLRHRVGVLPNV